MVLFYCIITLYNRQLLNVLYLVRVASQMTNCSHSIHARKITISEARSHGEEFIS